MVRTALKGRFLVLILCTAGLLSRQALADIGIEVTGVEGDMKRNVLTFLSLSRYANRDDLDADTIERISQRAPNEVKSALRPFGYYNPKVSALLAHQGNHWHARIAVEPGAPVILKQVDVQVTGPGESDRVFKTALDRSTLKVGRQLNHGDYERVKGDLERTAAAFGYLDAILTRHELIVDPAGLAASVQLQLETGQRYRFGAATIKQSVIDDELMRRYLRFHEGQFYDTTSLLRTQFALDDSQYFSSVEVLPGDRNAQDLTVPVEIQGLPNRRNRYSIGAGYGTDTKYRGTLAWDDRLINSHGHRAHLEIKASSITQQLGANYIIPVGDPALERLSVESTYGRTTYGDITATGLVVKPGLTQVLGNWQRVMYVELDRIINRTNFTRSSDFSLIPGISYASIPPGIFGQPVAGRGLYVELSGSHAALGSNSNFVRLFVQDDQRFDLSARWHLLLRGQIGISIVSKFSELPAFERFFAGGDRSVRGFGLNDLSPVNQYGEKIGGRDLLVGSVEIERDLPRNFGIATFFDAGNAMNSFNVPLEYSAGVGLRFKLPAISIGVDVAQALSRTDLGPRLHLNIQPIF
ncbi:MAG: BamA/TamA family outer membrane protein [Proteobacteria bacterium]|nr:BamA/TamA family outer membrane protein [Pseudomonadota bacterium]